MRVFVREVRRLRRNAPFQSGAEAARRIHPARTRLLAAVAQSVAFETLVFTRLADEGEDRNQYLNCNQDQCEAHAYAFAWGSPLGKSS